MFNTHKISDDNHSSLTVDMLIRYDVGPVMMAGPLQLILILCGEVATTIMFCGGPSAAIVNGKKNNIKFGFHVPFL